MKCLSILFAVGLLLSWCFAIDAIETREPEPQCDESQHLPKAIDLALKQAPDIVVSCRIKPPVIQGDFDGDGRPDYAVLVTQGISKKRGFLIAFANGKTAEAGAGRSVKYGAALSSDLNFDQWGLYRKYRPVESAKHQQTTRLRGDALIVSYHETASGLFYWDGKRIRWYQQGD